METSGLKAYEVVQKKTLTDLQTEGYLLKHKKSGARVLLMENRDNNKVFTIGFRTPPEDSTGLPHILEHSVLCGSRNFPSKDPFVELVKGSLNTFLNAMTYPDKTLYPVASCNDKDFQNLMHVYMDAVFYPNIYRTDKIFRQEGWNYHLEDAKGELTYNGVVYNEMKGAFSSPEGVLDRVILNSLFPDTSYANESGGDPEVIPDLTYEQFIAFHKKYYHPSNSYIYLYGDMDMLEKLTWLDQEYLSEFDSQVIESEIQRQLPFESMREVTIPYSVSEEEPLKDNTYLSYSKVIGTSLDAELYLAFQVLDYILLSAPGAVLKKALLDAGIGKDIMGGYDNMIYQPIFSVIAKNANLEQKDKMLQVLEETLKNLVRDKIDQNAVAAAINYHEFRYREADFGNYPKGLVYILEMLGSWLYDDSQPFIHVEALDIFEKLKEKNGTGYYEQLIETYLLHNTHSSFVSVVPEKGRTARMDQELSEHLKQFKAGLDMEAVERLVTATKELEAYQEEPSDEEDLKKIPILQREDISREIEPIINEELDINGIPVIYHETPTNGIAYVDLLFDLSGVSSEWLPYVGLLQAVLGLVDTTGYGYGELFDEINVHTGGIGTSLEVYPDITKSAEKEFKATFEVKGKAVYEKLPVLFEMMEEILLESKFTDDKRLVEILDMIKSRLQMRLQSAGHTAAVLRSQSYASPIAALKDMTSGIAFYEKTKYVSEHFAEVRDDLTRAFRQLSEMLFCRTNVMISVTGDRECLKEMPELTAKLNKRLHMPSSGGEGCLLHCEKKNEGFKTSSKVQYVARTGNFMDAGIPYTGALQILKVILGYDYLWNQVRVKGGAYGCMCGFNRLGEGFFVSYRDPHLKRTDEVYRGIADYIRNFNVSERDMTKYIIGTMSNLDQPLTPAAKGERSMNLYMNKLTKEQILKERMQILDAQQEDIQALAAVASAVVESGQFCVIGNESKIEKEKDLFKEVRSLF